MQLTRYHCDELILTLRAGRDDFHNEQFFRDPRLRAEAKNWEKGASLELLHYTLYPKISDYHVHTQLRLVGQKVRLVIYWTRGVVRRKPGAEYPFAEDVHEWIRKFLKPDVYPITVYGHFLFPSSRYISAVGLPMPFWGPTKRERRKRIVGLQVSAELRGAEDAMVITAAYEKHVFISVAAWFRTKLSRLDPEGLLKKFNRLVLDFVEER